MMKQDENIINAQSKHIEPARVEELSSFTIGGVSTVTTNAAELSGNGKIGELFERYHSHYIGDQLREYQQHPGHYSCYFNYEEDDAGHYEFMVGVHVQEALQGQYPESIKTFTVPAAKYAVFVTARGPIIEVVQRAWSNIWRWSQQAGNERAFSGDFEYYDPHIDPNDGQAEIYIALRK